MVLSKLFVGWLSPSDDAWPPPTVDNHLEEHWKSPQHHLWAMVPPQLTLYAHDHTQHNLTTDTLTWVDLSWEFLPVYSFRMLAMPEVIGEYLQLLISEVGPSHRAQTLHGDVLGITGDHDLLMITCLNLSRDIEPLLKGSKSSKCSDTLILLITTCSRILAINFWRSTACSLDATFWLINSESLYQESHDNQEKSIEWGLLDYRLLFHLSSVLRVYTLNKCNIVDVCSIASLKLAHK